MAGGENDAWASTIFERSRYRVQHAGCKRRPYRLSARALSSLEVSYSYIRNSKDADCPTLPISAGSSRFCRRSPASRLDRRRDNSDPACPQALLLIVQYRHTVYECPAIGVLECTCGTMAAIMNYNGRGDVSSARANAALGAIIVDNTVLPYSL